ncbi:penicillin-binding transpeptidase domain-containing protein [Streptomyces sp. NBC_00582]|uniref:penicillin-binding transpeptidase domain-containing protein n=1 Tax=Streptomyces sp. NBC_00582 TaxID=2975783 RepID=UPI002E80239E|nr:penicillin-binding transpeptidase domain-containing protein [Streptomyces sp. NBC_00582]WUB64034.1 penicillin-binding transpeptidase domain-containing protein [Streptomyces sp. NBC_00582]
MRKGAKAAIVGSVFVVMVGGAGYGAFNIVSALNGGDGSGSGGPAPVKTGPPSGGEVKDTSTKFFAAWEKGEAAAAAALTNNAEKAEPLLTSYSGTAHIDRVTITPGAARGATVPFSVKATVSYEGKSKPLAYKSELTVVRGLTTGKALVDWQPAVVHPDLKDMDDTLVTGDASAPPIEAVDRDGKVLTKQAYPSLGPILDELRAKYGDKAGGTPGVELAIHHAAPDTADTPLLTLSEGKAGKLPTTLSARVQAAAEKAVTQYRESSVVAVKPSTGEVLAVANNRTDGWNAAFLGEVAPGSTWKIVSAATLIDNGITSANGPAPCPAEAVWQSQTFHNIKNMPADENATLSESFARSCNTAFVKFADEVKVDSLTDEARDRFGIGLDWKTGIPSFDGSVPASGGPDTAANLIGQGQVQVNPLNLASVTATAMTGTFRQPVIVPQSLDDRELARARGLSASTVQQLRAMMNRTATSGTAAEVMSGLGVRIGAKTGSAEVDGQTKSNSWFTGYRDDVAAAAMVQDGGHGVDASGPLVAQVLRAG